MVTNASGIVVPIQPEDVPKDLICAICLEIPLTPIVTNCSHVFCQDCIKQSQNHHKGAANSCPVCRCEYKTITRLEEGSPLAHRIWSNIPVKCQHHAEGCCWTGSISDYKYHKKVCPRENQCQHTSNNATAFFLKEKIKQLQEEILVLEEANEKWKRKFLDAVEEPVANGRGGYAFEV